MKINSLAAAVILAGLTSTSAFAASTDVALHGMIKSGTNWVTNDGFRRGAHGGIGINEQGYFHAFGNEAVHKVQINPTVNYTADDGVYARGEIIFSHENYDNEDWNADQSNGGGFRRAVVYLGGFDFNPSTEFWGGKTKDAAGSIFTGGYDTGYIEDYGVGGGFQNMDIGIAKWDFNIISFDDFYGKPTTTKISKQIAQGNYDKNGTVYEGTFKTGAPTATAITTWLHGIAGTGLDYYFRIVKADKDAGMRNDGHYQISEKATDGFQTAVIYNTPGYLGFADGFAKVIVQYGKGTGAAAKIASAAYGINKDQEFTRFAIDGCINFTENLSMLNMLFLQHDHRINGAQTSRDFYTASVRPVYQVSPHFSLQFELAYEHASYTGKGYLNDNPYTGYKAKHGKHDAFKVTFAPTLQLNPGIWGSPSITPFITYGKWSQKAVDAGLVSGDGAKAGYTNSSDVAHNANKAVVLVGVQAQAYF
ncbi:MAG: carbohydrate porin [Succinivibrio sp.]